MERALIALTAMVALLFSLALATLVEEVLCGGLFRLFFHTQTTAAKAPR